MRFYFGLAFIEEHRNDLDSVWMLYTAVDAIKESVKENEHPLYYLIPLYYLTYNVILMQLVTTNLST